MNQVEGMADGTTGRKPSHPATQLKTDIEFVRNYCMITPFQARIAADMQRLLAIPKDQK